MIFRNTYIAVACCLLLKYLIKSISSQIVQRTCPQRFFCNCSKNRGRTEKLNVFLKKNNNLKIPPAKSPATPLKVGPHQPWENHAAGCPLWDRCSRQWTWWHHSGPSCVDHSWRIKPPLGQSGKGVPWVYGECLRWVYSGWHVLPHGWAPGDLRLGFPNCSWTLLIPNCMRLFLTVTCPNDFRSEYLVFIEGCYCHQYMEGMSWDSVAK